MPDDTSPQRDVEGSPAVEISDGGEAADVPLTPSVVFGILADKSNRFVLYLLENRGGTVALEELATAVAAWENDTVPSLITNEMEKRVRSRLYHATVPKLSEYGIVSYDADTEAVTLTDLGEQLEPYLEFAKQRERDDVEDFLEENRPGRE